jgi:hypothetical protein
VLQPAVPRKVSSKRSSSLREGVALAIQRLGDGILRHPENKELRRRVLLPQDDASHLTGEALYGQLLGLVYRVLILLVCEDRGLVGRGEARPDGPLIGPLRRLLEPGAALGGNQSLWRLMHDAVAMLREVGGEAPRDDGSQGSVLILPKLESELLRENDLARLSVADEDVWAALASVVGWEGRTARVDSSIGRGTPRDFASMPNEELGTVYESLLDYRPTIVMERSGVAAATTPPRLGLERGSSRRSSGSYYTPPALIDEVIRSSLEPVIRERLAATTARCFASDDASRDATECALLAISVCDPACGSGHFLLGAARRLGRELADVGARDADHAMRAAIKHCVCGVDKNSLAVDLCRVALWLESGCDPDVARVLHHRIKRGDSLIGVSRMDAVPPLARAKSIAAHTGASPAVAHAPRHTVSAQEACDAWTATFFQSSGDGSPRRPDDVLRAFADGCAIDARVAQFVEQTARTHCFFHWPLEFEAVASGGFDVVLGNPPWIAHAGRAAQPLHAGVRRFVEATNPACSGYRTTHAMMIRRAAELVRPGGMVGLIVPTSVSDLDGYAPARAAFDALCDVTPCLADFGAEAFEGVFQPCMALVGRGRIEARTGRSACWSLRRGDLTHLETALLARMAMLSPVDPRCFGERGVQTNRAMRARLADCPTASHTVALREGGTIREFTLLPPSLHADPADLAAWSVDASAFSLIPIVLRQTARYPIATLHDGLLFRNSLLAAFPVAPWTAPSLCAYLNSTLIRWLHYKRYRDARQGMPQVKIGHLRSIPAPPQLDTSLIGSLHAIGVEATGRNSGLDEVQRDTLDRLVEASFDLTTDETLMLRAWARAMPK